MSQEHPEPGDVFLWNGQPAFFVLIVAPYGETPHAGEVCYVLLDHRMEGGKLTGREDGWHVQAHTIISSSKFVCNIGTVLKNNLEGV